MPPEEFLIPHKFILNRVSAISSLEQKGVEN